MSEEHKGGNTPVSPEKEEEGRDIAEHRIYEIGYLLMPTLSETDVPREVTALKDLLEKEKTRVISGEFPKLRILAYPMRKRVGLSTSNAEAGGGLQTYTNAYFGWVKFEGQGGNAQRIEKELAKNEQILRYMLLKTIREHTMTMGRSQRIERAPRREAPKDVPTSAPVSEAELDKSIEKLIGES